MVKVRVGAVIVTAAGILLVEHRRRGLAYWTLPGGGQADGETIEACVGREVEEETGYHVEVGALLIVADVVPPNGSADGQVLNLVFSCTIAGGDLDPWHGRRPGERHDRVEFVPLDTLAEIDLRPPVVPEIARCCRDGYLAPARYLGNLWRAADGTVPGR